MRGWACALLAFAVAAAACAGARAESVKIRIAWITIGNPPPLLAAKKDLARHWGQSYDVDPSIFKARHRS